MHKFLQEENFIEIHWQTANQVSHFETINVWQTGRNRCATLLIA